jgi:ABC-2 type transport system permease protein
MFAVLKREYLQAVRKKAFIIMTILFPLLMVGAMMLPALMVSKGMGKKKVAVLDGTGALRDAFQRPNEQEKVDTATQLREASRGRRRELELLSQLDIEYVSQAGQTLESASQPYLERLQTDDKSRRLDGVFLIPANALDAENARMTYYSRSATDVMTQERLGRLTNKVIQRRRLAASGIDAAMVERLTRDVGSEGVQISKSGEQVKGGEANIFLAFVFAALLILPSFIYGNEIMRGIVQEKSERVVEVLVSSMKPRELLTGKILGVAAVGLTQVTVWMLMLAAVGAYGAIYASAAGFNIGALLRPMIFVYFLVFFSLAYLTYVCVYAIAGAICNSEKEAQQFVAPITLVMMIPWFLMMPIIMNPDSRLAVGFSLSPVFAPITMFVRTLVSEPPFWQIAVAIGASIATILVFFYITAKIFRVGILSYGKRPTIPELWRWLRVA